MNAMIQQPNDTTGSVTRTGNPFASGTIATRPSSNAVADASQAREVAEVQAAMTIAQRFPRNAIAATDRILQACTRPTLAEGALYSYSRGGQEITGPSIRLAEACAQAWGNITFGIREVEQRSGASTVEAFAHDLETNTRQVKVFQVEHKRFTKRGAYALEDPRDVYELVANQGARRLRACILGVIPGDVIEAAVRQCEETLHASADTSADGLKKLVTAFEKFGITQSQIETRCQCRLDAIRPAQVVQLKKVYASLRDGMSAPRDWFEQPADAANAEPITGGNEGAKAAIKARTAKTAPKQSSDPTPEPAPADSRGLTTQEVHDAIAAATTADALDEAASLIDLTPETGRGALHALYGAREKELKA